MTFILCITHCLDSYEPFRKLILSSCGDSYSFVPSWAHYKRASLRRWNFLTQDGNRPSYQNVTFSISYDDERRPKQNMFTVAPHHYNICMSAHTAPCILTSTLRQIWMVSFALHSLYSQEKSHGTHRIVGRFEARNLLPMGRIRTLRETKGLLLALFKKADKILDDMVEHAVRTEMNKMHQLHTESIENNHLTDPDLDGDDMKRDLREIRSDDVVRTEKSVIGSCESLRMSLYGGKFLYRQKFLSFSRGFIFNATDYRSRSINPRDLNHGLGRRCSRVLHWRHETKFHS